MQQDSIFKSYSYPDQLGHFGEFGGRYVGEVLLPVLDQLEKAFHKAQSLKKFQKTYHYYLKNYVGRPTPLFFASRLSKKLGHKIYLKREDLCHLGSHKANNTLGQILLARMMKKTRVIAETGSGQHGVATSAVCALFNLPCTIYMGERDYRRHTRKVKKMEFLGSQIVPVASGHETLKDALNEALRDWITHHNHTYYCLGSAAGPHPYPTMVRNFQSIIGKETQRQILKSEKRAPDMLIACVGGGANALGFFYPFLTNSKVEMVGVEAGGKGLKSKKHAAAISTGKIGIMHGQKTYLVQSEEGQAIKTHSIGAGLDYPGVGPEISFLAKSQRVHFEEVTDEMALEAFLLLSRLEGIFPALEASHALAWLIKKAKKIKPGSLIVICLSGSGAKDINTVARHH